MGRGAACRADGALAVGIASAPGTCGELAQGLLDRTSVMVTCPIDLHATATVALFEGSGRVRGPANAPKARRAVALTLASLGSTDLDARLSLEGQIPRKKGMASSTADVAAAIGATAAALGTHLSARRQADLALAIEPSDGVMLPGIALFDHRNGRIAKRSGDPPAMRILVLEFADTVDTEAFNAVDRNVELRRQAARFQEALALITAGVACADAELVGRGATESALAYQRVLPKPQLPAVLEIGRAAGAMGVNVAHSGTVMGLMFGEDAERVRWAAHHVSRRLPGLLATHEHRVIGGGVMQHGAARERERPATREMDLHSRLDPSPSAAVQRS